MTCVDLQSHRGLTRAGLIIVLEPYLGCNYNIIDAEHTHLAPPPCPYARIENIYFPLQWGGGVVCSHVVGYLCRTYNLIGALPGLAL